MLPNIPEFPAPGLRVHENSHGATILRLHYSADPEKAAGEPIYVPEIDRHLSPWAYEQYKHMTDSNAYLREFEIEAEATLGRLIFNLDEEATIEDSYEIPPDCTRRMTLDPHPSVPHAYLWCATNRWNERIYYREFWPSRACYRYDENGKLTGKPGPCPEDEPPVYIKDYVEIVHYLESKENPENKYRGESFDEVIHERIIDYAARGFGKGTNDDPEQASFQQRYEQYMILPKIALTCPTFTDAKKDRDVGFEVVNAGLKAKLVEGADGKMHKRSPIRIFRDRCPELIYQLKNNRRQLLTPQQAQVKDPTGKMVPVRCHETDCMRYNEMSGPSYVDCSFRPSRWEPITDGIAY